MTSPKVFYSIQALRALAALMVVTLHCGYAYEAWVKPSDFLPWYNTHIFGAAGVHLFFVISGFVIASQRAKTGGTGALHFAINRLARIVPMYWFCTLVFVAIRYFFDAGASSNYALSAIWIDLLRSMFFVPSSAQPVLSVGWTLNYEMFFYLVFGLVVVLAGRSTYVVTALFAILVVADTYFGNLGILAQPIVLEFCAGILAYKVHKDRLLGAAGPYILTAGTLVLCSSAIWFKPDSATGWTTVFAWGLPSMFIVIGATAWENRRPNLLRWRPITAIGDASYSLYLIHPIVFYGRANLAAVLFLDVPLIRDAGPHLATLALVTIITGLAALLHKWLEAPLSLLTKRLLRRMALSKLSGSNEQPVDLLVG